MATTNTSLVGRAVVTVDGPGFSFGCPSNKGVIVCEESTRWGDMIRVEFEDGRAEGFMRQSLRASDDLGIGIYLA